MKKLVIIDGKSVFYRGYYAMGALSLPDGTPTGGIFGFAAIAMEIVKKLNPTKVVVAWDSKTSTEKRKAIFADYKAGRVKPGDDFYAQIPLLKAFIEGLGWYFCEIDAYEADDIIGTLAKQADDLTDWETYIISSDLDMLQIVDENTRMWRILKGFSNIEEIDVAEFENKYGILKSQFLDMKALKGDNSDNIPGVPGIGEKGAVKLLNKFITLDGIYAHLDEIDKTTREKLITGKESAYMSKKLAKIMVDAPINLEKIPNFSFDGLKTKTALEKLRFNSLIKKFNLEGDGESAMKVAEEPAETRQLPDDVLVLWDVKEEMHQNLQIEQEILGGNKKYWDLAQGRFLLDPLAREEEQGDKAAEYFRQQKMFGDLPKLNNIFVQFDLPLIPVLFSMEKKGVQLDKNCFNLLKMEYDKKVVQLEQEIYEISNTKFNINSPIQLSEVLFDKLGLSIKGIKKTTRGYSTGAKELEKLKNEHKIIPKIIEYREVAKLLSTYIIPLPELADENNRVHTTFTQNVTATGRLSSVNPNLQNIPTRSEEGKRIREGFVAGDGKVFVSADYSQFELRLAAVLAGDENLIKDFNSGVDIHTKTAAEAFKIPMENVTKLQRRAAKVINFGVLYGMSAKGLAEAAEMSFDEARKFIEQYFELRKPIKIYLDKILKQAREEGYVETYFGRRRPTPDVKSSNFLIRTAAERAAQNMPIQGTEADLVKRAMIRVFKALPKGAELVLQIHDSLIVECDESLQEEVKEILVREMTNVAPELDIKLDVDVTVGKNWGEL